MRWVLGCVAAAAIMSGCGGGDDEGDGGPDRAEVTQRADAICAKASADVAAVKPLGRASGGEELATLLGEVRRIADRQLRELDALEAGDDAVRKDLEALVAAERRQLDVLTQLQREAGDQRPRAFLDRVAARGAASDRAINAAADRLGALRCGSAGD